MVSRLVDEYCGNAKMPNTLACGSLKGPECRLPGQAPRNWRVETDSRHLKQHNGGTERRPNPQQCAGQRRAMIKHSGTQQFGEETSQTAEKNIRFRSLVHCILC